MKKLITKHSKYFDVVISIGLVFDKYCVVWISSSFGGCCDVLRKQNCLKNDFFVRFDTVTNQDCDVLGWFGSRKACLIWMWQWKMFINLIQSFWKLFITEKPFYLRKKLFKFSRIFLKISISWKYYWFKTTKIVLKWKTNFCWFWAKKGNY